MRKISRGGCIDFPIFVGVISAIIFGICCAWLLANTVI